jgi:hypothetical protein
LTPNGDTGPALTEDESSEEMLDETVDQIVGGCQGDEDFVQSNS